jgi:beta-lactamase class A
MLHTQLTSRAAEFTGDFGMFAQNLTTGETVGVNEDAVMPTASTIKICVLCELYRQVEEGLVDLQQRHVLTAADHWGGSGVLKEFEPGLAPTALDLARMMIVVSDNVATAVLVRLLGKDRINQTMRDWGLAQTTLIFKRTRANGIRDYALSTPRELVRLLEAVATDAVLTPASCAAIRDHLARQQYQDQIPRYLPHHPYADYLGITPQARVANKTGFYVGVRVDAAIVNAASVDFVIATMTENSTDLSFSTDHEGTLLNAAAAKLVYDAWSG